MADTDDTPVDNSVAPIQSDVTASQDVKERPSKPRSKIKKILIVFLIVNIVSFAAIAGLRMATNKASRPSVPAPMMANDSNPASVPAPMAASESKPVSAPAPMVAQETKPVSVPAKTQVIVAASTLAPITKPVMKEPAPQPQQPAEGHSQPAVTNGSSPKKPTTLSFVRRGRGGEEILHDFTRESR